MKNILCFGDSNTFGTNPLGGRHPREIRWPGRLQMLLGEEYYVIEEGMGGRTTVWDDPLEPGRCGIQMLPIALHSHRPLDLVILMLGTNDCKAHFHASPKVIARGMENLCRLVQRYDYGAAYPVPQILVVSPIFIGEDMDNCPYDSFDGTAPEKSRLLAPLYQKVAETCSCRFLDASRAAGPSDMDQLHMDGENHILLAQAMAEAVRGIFEKRT